jgi:hypothetical protein
MPTLARRSPRGLNVSARTRPGCGQDRSTQVAFRTSQGYREASPPMASQRPSGLQATAVYAAPGSPSFTRSPDGMARISMQPEGLPETSRVPSGLQQAARSIVRSESRPGVVGSMARQAIRPRAPPIGPGLVPAQIGPLPCLISGTAGDHPCLISGVAT